MFLVLKSLIAVALGVALGLAATYRAVERGVSFGAVQAGPWKGWPKAGARDSDPYIRAARARSGEMPLGITEGLSFVARADGDGAILDPRCDYIVSGLTPPTRFWTLTAMTPEGHVVETRTHRYGFTSSEVTRDAAGDFTITVSAQARPGNWLPVAPGGSFTLALRLYDTSLSASAYSLDASLMPAIKRGQCL